ncbi:Glutaredoxin [Parasponia andersonii]|uniref:Glutaredoxin n=1 Tax=Parasponia andersonii TaxID=3476 RepID=A0A2P5D950_PARAD|nr:Glutaredoxin [Parasponia andersonii]
MADCGKKLELSEKPRFSFFNRSLSMYPAASAMDSPLKPHLQTPLERTSSFSKLYNSIESVRSTSNSIKGKVKKLCSIFETTATAKALPSPSDEPPQSQLSSKLKPSKSIGPDCRISSFLTSSTIRLPGTEDRIVVFLTSLRGIRRTYEDCYAVRTIFRGFRVWVDERDISMDSAYRIELQSVLGNKNVGLPQVFIRGNYVGGAEVIKQLFETGELAKILEGFPVREPGFRCESCGDVRFVPCLNCSGSRKVFDEDKGMLKRCLECNENGLIRCPDCCS